jgi:biopolymer transport protein TolR
MKMSIRAKRMQRHHRKGSSTSKLNLVSLMDIFTILVFFLMVNQSNVEVLQSDKTIKLPDSTVEQVPKETVLISINPTQILVQGKQVLSTEELLGSETDLSEKIIKELNYHASRTVLTEQDIDLGRPITILAHKDTPYKIIKRIMASCAETDYRNISFAVNKIAKKEIVEPVND